jgi:hypothetical protein
MKLIIFLLAVLNPFALTLAGDRGSDKICKEGRTICMMITIPKVYQRRGGMNKPLYDCKDSSEALCARKNIPLEQTCQ